MQGCTLLHLCAGESAYKFHNQQQEDEFVSSFADDYSEDCEEQSNPFGPEPCHVSKLTALLLNHGADPAIKDKQASSHPLYDNVA